MAALSPFIRVILRILGGILLGLGYVRPDDLWLFSDEEMVGILVLIISEGWYLVARRFGWAT